MTTRHGNRLYDAGGGRRVTVPDADPFGLPLSPGDVAEMFADPEFGEWCAEMDARRAADEAVTVRRYEVEHAERFGCDYGGDGQFPY